MKRSCVKIVCLGSLCMWTLILSSGCRRSVIRLDTGEKFKARVINADEDHIYVVTPQKQVRVVERERIQLHRPPGTLTMVIGGFYTVAYSGILLSQGFYSDSLSLAGFSGFILGSFGVLVTGGIIRWQAVERYRRGLQIKDVARRVRVEPMLSTGASHQAGIRVRF
jgi:hypothetical protein